MTVVTVNIEPEIHELLTKIAHDKGVKLAPFIRIVMGDMTRHKNKGYISDLKLPKTLTHLQVYKKKGSK